MSTLVDIEERRAAAWRRSTSLCAVGGCGGAATSTLARQLVRGGPLAVVEVDDVSLPSGWRVAVPAAPGRNLDLARLVEQVLAPLAEGRGLRFQRYDWEAEVLGEGPRSTPTSPWSWKAPPRPAPGCGTAST